jgi:hypothetical protein
VQVARRLHIARAHLEHRRAEDARYAGPHRVGAMR